MVSRTSLGQRWHDYRPSKKMLAAACATSVVLTLALGFTYCGWTSGERAATLASVAAHQARTDLAATMCANRFLAAPDATERLGQLRQHEPWYRGEVLEDAGWTSLPGMPNLAGSREPVLGAAARCAQLLTAEPSVATHLATTAKRYHAGNS